MIARCSAASRVPFGGSAALDAACAPYVGCALIAGHPAHALALHVGSAAYVWFVLLHLEHAGLSLASMPVPRRRVRTLVIFLQRLMTKDPQGARPTAFE